LLTFLKYLTNRWPPWILLCGIFWTLAFLTREETILLGFFVIVIALLFHVSIKHIFWFLLPFVPAFALRNYYLYRTFGSLHLNVQSLWRLPYWEQFYSLEPFSLSQYLSYVGGIGGAMQIRVFNYLTFARNFWSDGLFLDSDTGILPLLAIPVLILAYLRRMDRKRRIFVTGFSVFGVLMTLVILTYPGYAATSAGTRHAQLLGPFLLIMTSAGLLDLWNGGVATNIPVRRNKTFGLTRYLRWALVGLFVANYVFMCFTFLTINLDRWVFRRPFMADLRQAAEWGETHLPPTATIMTRKPEIVHYYSKFTAVVPPLTDFATMMLYAERNEVTHIVISSQERDRRPNLLPGILAHPANFRLVYEERRAQIYEVLSYHFGLKELHRAEYDQYLDDYEDPHRPFSWGDLSGRRGSVSRSLIIWGQWLAEGRRVGQEWWDGVKYGQLNWLYKIVHRPEHRLEADFGRFRLLGYNLDTNVLEDEGVLDVALYWQSLEPVEEDYIIVVKLVNNVYHVWGESQGRLWGDEFWASRWTEDLVIGDSHRIELLPATPPGLYRLEINVIDSHSWQILEPNGETKMLSEHLEIPRSSLSIEALDVEHSLGADLGGKVRLLGYNIESGFRPGDNIHLTLFWQCLEEMEQSYTVFTHLVDAVDGIVAQKDNPPVDGFYPTTMWEVGEIVRDQYDLVIPSDAPSGEYRLNVGMYLAETGARLNVLEDGVPLLDNQILLQPVTVGGLE
jgi:hypothetical protein